MRFIDRMFAYGVDPFDPIRWRSPDLSIPEREQVLVEDTRALIARQRLEDPGYDALLAGARNTIDKARTAATEGPDLDALDRVPVFAADDVGRYLMRLAQDGQIAIETQVATMAPPFDEYWVEFDRVPNHIGLRAWGVHVRAEEDQGNSWPPMPGDTDVPRWRLWLKMYVELAKREAMGPVAWFVAGLAEDGTWFRHDDGELYWGGGPIELDPPIDPEEARSFADPLVTFMAPALMTTSLLHCKNVELQTVEPDQKLSRNYAKKRGGGRPLTTYHVIDIEPMRRILDAAGAQEGQEGLRRALHLCRGHFKVFTPDAPLFGRHVGTYWWAPHVRGRAEQGIALKDYRVSTPQGFGRSYREAPESELEMPQGTSAQRAGSSDEYGRGLRAHNRTQNQLAEQLRHLGVEPVSPDKDEPDYDLGFKLGDRVVAIEVKSLTEKNEEFQLRLGLGQVLRYRQKLTAAGHRDVQAVVAVEREPTDPSWDTGFQLDGVTLIWPEVWATRLEDIIVGQQGDDDA